MNIDLLMTETGEPGLVADTALQAAAAGALYDAHSGQITLEFANMDFLELNIPVEEDTGDHMALSPMIHVGVIHNGVITDYRQIPLILSDDPFGGAQQGRLARKPRRSVEAFEAFMKLCVAGQPVHRHDLGDEGKSGSIVGGINPAILKFAPHLARAKVLERNAAPLASYTHEPDAPGLGPRARVRRPVQKQPPRRPRDDED